MTNALRNQYLEKLGIVQYVSKDLPVVAAAPKGADSTEAIDQSVVLETNASDVQKKSMAELVNLGLEEKPEPAPASQVVASSTESPTEIELQFALWQVNNNLIVTKFKMYLMKLIMKLIE